jgi:hypothetical protein
LPAWIKEGYATEKRQEQLYEKVILPQISNRSCLKLKNSFREHRLKKLCLLMPDLPIVFLPKRKSHELD